jgi:hypothetical protein
LVLDLRFFFAFEDSYEHTLRIKKIESSSFPTRSNVLFSKGLGNKSNKGGLSAPRQLSDDDNTAKPEPSTSFHEFEKLYLTLRLPIVRTINLVRVKKTF